MVYGSTQPITIADVEHNLGLASEPLASAVANSALTAGGLRVSPYHRQGFTDDLAPVERLIDEIIFSYATRRRPYSTGGWRGTHPPSRPHRRARSTRPQHAPPLA